MTMINRVRWKFQDNKPHRKFVAERLLALKSALSDEIRGQTSETSLRLATWNIMHFGDGGGYDRTEESMLYIAEIIDHFDLVAVQEVNRNLAKLEDLLDNYLGDGWDYLVTDTAGDPGGKQDAGNAERLAFLFRKSKIVFQKEVGEIVLPEGQEIVAAGETEVTRKVQFARTPFAVAFRSSWLKFKLCTVHIFYGEGGDNSPAMDQRRDEIEKVARFLAARQELERSSAVKAAKSAKPPWAKPEEAGYAANYLLLGDFNIISPSHRTMQALIDAGFSSATPEHPTDLGNKMHYDQIAYKAAHPDFKVLKAGVFDAMESVYRDEDAEHYIDVVKVPRIVEGKDGARPRDKAIAYFKQTYRRNQLSDHKLLWCEICVDYATSYLEQIIAEPMTG